MLYNVQCNVSDVYISEDTHAQNASNCTNVINAIRVAGLMAQEGNFKGAQTRLIKSRLSALKCNIQALEDNFHTLDNECQKRCLLTIANLKKQLRINEKFYNLVN